MSKLSLVHHNHRNQPSKLNHDGKITTDESGLEKESTHCTEIGSNKVNSVTISSHQFYDSIIFLTAFLLVIVQKYTDLCANPRMYIWPKIQPICKERKHLHLMWIFTGNVKLLYKDSQIKFFTDASSIPEHKKSLWSKLWIQLNPQSSTNALEL